MKEYEIEVFVFGNYQGTEEDFQKAHLGDISVIEYDVDTNNSDMENGIYFYEFEGSVKGKAIAEDEHEAALKVYGNANFGSAYNVEVGDDWYDIVSEKEINRPKTQKTIERD